MERLIVCVNCESEFTVTEHYSDHIMHYCVYCGEVIETEEVDE